MVLDTSYEDESHSGGNLEAQRLIPMRDLSLQIQLQRHTGTYGALQGRGDDDGLDFVEGGVTFERAITEAGFGRFHLGITLLCGFIYLDTAMGITILSFVLPTAQCDFSMTSPQKGWLNASPMLGMVLGSYFWGCLADIEGRRTVLIAALLMDGICGLISSISQYYIAFLCLRFLNGFAITGAMGIVFPYLGEFQPTKYREKVLCWMEMFWTVGIILLPCIAWGIIPLNIRFVSDAFVFGSWQLFVAVCAVPSIIIAGWLTFYPESPKFLIESQKYDEAMTVLQGIYHKNTGLPGSEYPIKTLRETRSRSGSVTSLASRGSLRSAVQSRKDLKLLFNEVWAQTKLLFQPPHRKNIILTCLIQFGLTTSYYTLMMWFPELFDRFEAFERLHPEEQASVCEVSGINTSKPSCEDQIDSSVFLHTLIVGLACIPTSLWLPLCVHRLGAKFFLVFCMAVSGLISVGLYFVTNSGQNLALSCCFEALTSLGISVVYAVMVDLFPTNLRVMAAALSLTVGRGGALFGNVIFSQLIDGNCVLPIALFAGMLFVSAALCLLLPNTGKSELD